MVKKFIFTILLGVALAASVALAKDAPFPILAVRGTWEAQNDHGMKISVDVGQRVDDGHAVPVRVVLRNAQGEVFAKGEAVHQLDDPELIVLVHDEQGHALRVIMKADDEDTKGSSGSPNLSLLMTLESVSGTTGHYILGR